VPDIAVFIWSQILRDRNGEISNTFTTAPDWTIKILSPFHSQTRVTRNILHCLRHGNHLGWLIDPDEQTVFGYRPNQETEVFDLPALLLPVPSFVTELEIRDIWAWLRE